MRSVYVMAEEGSASLKIGHAANPRLRLSNMRVGSSRIISLVYEVRCEQADAVERKVHDLLAEQRVRGEWFSVTEEEARAAIAFVIAKLRVKTEPAAATSDYRAAEEGGAMRLRTGHRWYLREWLAHRGMRQEDLARAVGVDGGDVSKWVTGRRRYNEDVLEGFARALGITPAELLGTDPRALQAKDAA